PPSRPAWACHRDGERMARVHSRAGSRPRGTGTCLLWRAPLLSVLARMALQVSLVNDRSVVVVLVKARLERPLLQLAGALLEGGLFVGLHLADGFQEGVSPRV